MEKINFKKEKIPFTQVANCVLFDPNLSGKAKGLYAYLYSKPDDWDFALDRITKDFKDGRRAIYTGILELEEAGYLKREKIMGNSPDRGRTKYHLLSKIDSKPVDGFSNDAKQQRCKIDSISNTDIKVIKSINNKERASLNYLMPLPVEDVKEFTARFEASPQKIQDKAESLFLYCQSKGRKYKDYRALLLNALKRDFEPRRQTVAVVEEKVILTPEQKAQIEKQKEAIRNSMKI